MYSFANTSRGMPAAKVFSYERLRKPQSMSHAYNPFTYSYRKYMIDNLTRQNANQIGYVMLCCVVCCVTTQGNNISPGKYLGTPPPPQCKIEKDRHLVYDDVSPPWIPVNLLGSFSIELLMRQWLFKRKNHSPKIHLPWFIPYTAFGSWVLFSL